MNQKKYKLFGIFIFVITFIVIAGGLFYHIISIWKSINVAGQLDPIFNAVLENAFFSAIVFVLGFYPGLFYYRFGNEKNKNSKLINSALILMLIPAITMSFISIYLYYSSNLGYDPLAQTMGFFVYGIPSLFLYCVGILLLLTHKFKTKNFKLRTTEKIVTLVAIIFLIAFVFVGKGIAIYGESPLSIEHCDSLKTIGHKDGCHLSFSKARPDLAMCEKIQDSLLRDSCYKEKAGYYKDSSYCDKVTHSFLKSGCLRAAD